MDVQCSPFSSPKRFPEKTRYAIAIRQRMLVVRGEDMKRFLWATPMLFVLMSGIAFADSVTTLIGLDPNNGTGDNFGFFQQGNWVFMGIGGGTPYDFFNTGGCAPGSTLGGYTDVFFEGGVIQIGSDTYELDFN